MNNGPLLFSGILATLASSFWGLLIVSNSQIGSQQPVVLEMPVSFIPPPDLVWPSRVRRFTAHWGAPNATVSEWAKRGWNLKFGSARSAPTRPT
jgi:hypothetical protein